MPQSPSSALLRVQGSSKLAFGATTAALVTLASGGTAVLVTRVAHSVTSPTELPSGALPPDAAAPPGSLVVDHPAGTATPPSQPVDATERALHKALTARPTTPRRTLTAPLVPLPPAVHVVPPTAKPPVSAPPVSAPPVTVPPVTLPVLPPITLPVIPPITLPVTQPNDEALPASRQAPGQGKHHKGVSEGSSEGTGGRGSQQGHGRHARTPSHGQGRHAR
jgi:hypothetical protein